MKIIEWNHVFFGANNLKTLIRNEILSLLIKSATAVVGHCRGHVHVHVHWHKVPACTAHARQGLPIDLRASRRPAAQQ